MIGSRRLETMSLGWKTLKNSSHVGSLERMYGSSKYTAPNMPRGEPSRIVFLIGKRSWRLSFSTTPPSYDPESFLYTDCLGTGAWPSSICWKSSTLPLILSRNELIALSYSPLLNPSSSLTSELLRSWEASSLLNLWIVSKAMSVLGSVPKFSHSYRVKRS